MIFVIDLDDTICDSDSYSEAYIKNFIKKNNLPYKFINSISRFAEGKFDWDYETANKWYKTYGDEMMLHFPVKNNAVEIINSLYKDGHKIIICTARQKDWHTDPEGITKKWLKNVGLKYDKLYIGRVDKEKVCEEENADVFIDDDLNIISRVSCYFNSICKGKVFLIKTNYNKNLSVPKAVVKVKDFYEIVDCLNLNKNK